MILLAGTWLFDKPQYRVKNIQLWTNYYHLFVRYTLPYDSWIGVQCLASGITVGHPGNLSPLDVCVHSNQSCSPILCMLIKLRSHNSFNRARVKSTHCLAHEGGGLGQTQGVQRCFYLSRSCKDCSFQFSLTSARPREWVGSNPEMVSV